MKNQKKPTSKAAASKSKPVEDIPVEGAELLKISDLKEESASSVSEGLGDTVAKITGALGIKECESCIKRKAILNRMFSYLEISRDVTADEVAFIERLNKRPGYISDEEIQPLFTLYNSLYNKALIPCRCGGVINQIVNSINRSFEYYRNETK